MFLAVKARPKPLKICKIIEKISFNFEEENKTFN